LCTKVIVLRSESRTKLIVVPCTKLIVDKVSFSIDLFTITLVRLAAGDDAHMPPQHRRRAISEHHTPPIHGDPGGRIDGRYLA
jgi:hypothetical protein